MTAPDYALAKADFDNVRRDVHRRFGVHVEAAQIDQLLDESIAKEQEKATIQAFLPTLVERDVSEKLQGMLKEQGLDAAPRKEVLFVCERNAGRSQMAASVLAHHVDRDILFRTVGLKTAGDQDNTATAEHDYEVYPEVIEALSEKGYPTDVFYQKQLEPRTVHRADVVVLMGVDEAPGVPADRMVKWDIADPQGRSVEEVRAIRDSIEAKVQELLVELA